MMVKSFQLNAKKTLTICFAIFLSFFSVSQTNAELESYKAKYPGQHVIMKTHSNKVMLTMVKGQPQVVHNYRMEFLILDQNGLLSLTEELIEHSSFEQLTINEAYVLVPKGDGSEKVKVTQITTQDAETEGSIFHDDNKETRLIFPKMTIGALRVLDYSVVVSENKFPFGFNFCSYYPIENSTFEVISDTSIHTIINLYNTDKIKLETTVTILKNKRTSTWSTKNTPTYKMDFGSPNRNYFIPHLMGQISYFNTKAGKTNVLETLDDLHDWYFTNITEVYNEVPNAELKTIADSLTKNLSNELDKVEAVYYWVQDNIKYIAFEEGINGFVPRQPSAIIKKRYGDCKDMASLIYAMLKSVGITSYLSWIGSRDLPYKYSEFPSSVADNHMITVYKNGVKTYFLDATNSFLSIHDVASFTIGKEILLNIDEHTHEIHELPIPPSSYTTMRDTSYISIDGKKIKGNGVTEIGGYYNQLIHPLFHEVQADKIDEAAKSIITKGNNSCKVSNVKVKDIDDRDKPMIVSYDYTVDNYVTSLENETYINTVLDKEITYGELKKDRISPFQFEFKSFDSYTTILSIPSDYTVKSIPKNVDYKSDIVDFSIAYKTVNNEILMTLTMEVKTLLIYPEQFETWNKFYSISKKAMSESIVLIKK